MNTDANIQAAVNINLIVITARDIASTKVFYEALGLQFELEQHGSGPEHYAATCDGGLVLEIYPASERRPVSQLRLGFTIGSIAQVVDRIVATKGSWATPAKQGPWGLRATLSDPDGNKVDIVERQKAT